MALQNGDLVLRRGRDDWPNFIPRPMDYTHAGIGVARAGADAVVDACPIVGDRLHVVDHVDVDEFLGATLAPGGGAVYRLHPRVGKPKSKGAAAANWAAARVGRSHEFNLFASLNPEAVDQVGHASMPVYCSQFVYCAYSIGAQLELVLPEDRFDIKSPENIDATLEAIVALIRRNGGKEAKLAEKVVRRKALSDLAYHDGWVVFPDCLSNSPFVERVAARCGEELSDET